MGQIRPWIIGILALGPLLPAQVILPIVTDPTIHRVLRAGDDTWALGREALYRVDGNRAIPTVWFPTPPRDVVVVAGATWVLTGDEKRLGPAALLENGSITWVPDAETPVRALAVIGTDVWLSTPRGAHRWREGEITAVYGDDLDVHAITRNGSDTWFRTPRGAYRLRGGEVRRIPDETIGVEEIRSIGPDVWLRTASGAYRIREDGVRRFPDADVRVTRLEMVGGQILLATSRGAYVVAPDDSLTPLVEDWFVSDIQTTSVAVWLTTSDGAYRVLPGEPATRLPNRGLDDTIIRVCGARVWIGSRQGTFTVDSGGVRQATEVDGAVRRIEVIDGVTWLVTDGGLFRAEDASVERCLDAEVSVQRLLPFGDRLWVIADGGLFSIRGRSVHRVPGADISIRDALPDGRVLWVASDQGLWRVDPDDNIQIAIATEPSSWKALVERVMGQETWLPNGVSLEPTYAHGGPDLDPWHACGVIVMTDEDAFFAALAKNAYTPWTPKVPTLPRGKVTLHVAIRDPHGNVTVAHIEGRVIPTLPALILVLAASWMAFVFFLAWAAGRSARVCALVTRPFFARVASLGIMPALCGLPGFRRWLQQHYVRDLRQDRLVKEWRIRYVPHFGQQDASELLDLVVRSGILLITGDPGAGKSAQLRYCLSSWANEYRRGDPVPLRIDLAGCQDVDPLAQCAAELMERGSIADARLARKMITAGGFVIIVDGLDEMHPRFRPTIWSFVESASETNSMIFAAEGSRMLPAVEAPQVALPALSLDNAQRMVHTRLPPEQADAVNANLPFVEAVYSVPQHLEIVCDIVHCAQGRLPPELDLRTIYRTFVAPVLTDPQFESEVTQLAAAAYRGIQESDPLATEALLETSPLFQSALRRAGIATDRGFSHPMVAAFIASLHFSSRWMDSIAELPEAGPLFIPLLRFAILEVASHDDDALLGTCLLGLMETNHRLGLDVIQWLQTYHPEIHERGLGVADA